MTDMDEKEKDWAEKVIKDNEKGLERLASEDSAKEKRQHPVIQKARNFYRKFVGREEKVSTVEL